MCRLVLMNKQGEKELEKNYGLENYFRFLEKSFGGHGNGYVLVRKGKIIDFNKGVNLSVKEISKDIRKKNYDWCIFHTRLASIGQISDRNCHPFIKNNEVMAMNGSEHSVNFLSKPLEITDTEAILDMKTKYNLGIPALKHFRSIFVGFSNKIPYVVANNTYNIKLLRNLKKDAIVFASDFPEKIKENVYEPIKRFIWNNEEIDMKNFKKCNSKRYYQRNRTQIDWKEAMTKKYEKMLEETPDEFDYYSDLYEEYLTEKEEYNKGGEKNVA